MIFGIIAGVISFPPVLLGISVLRFSLGRPVTGIAGLKSSVAGLVDAGMARRRPLLAMGIAGFGILVAGLFLLGFGARSCS